MRKSIDFDRVARWYDLYACAIFDLPFWVEEARRHPGRGLELMCGTGRISLAILGAGIPLTCVDYSAGLLAVFQEKLAQRGLAAEVIEQDVRTLRLAASYDWAFIGFHAFAELYDEGDRRAALQRIAAALVPAGTFSCALHNPAVRGPQLDGRWHDATPIAVPGGGRLEWRWRSEYDASTGNASGVQAYRERDAAGRPVAEVELPIHFHLIAPGAFEALVRDGGFEVVSRWGDYDRTPFHTATSPYFLCEARRRA